ncbi:MAG: ABC transporter substrate-binding protein [candidate division NC10 bacterium]|nr:ABC transporter substrate-binding protein [candidate division NC10 bacterium]
MSAKTSARRNLHGRPPAVRNRRGQRHGGGRHPDRLYSLPYGHPGGPGGERNQGSPACRQADQRGRRGEQYAEAYRREYNEEYDATSSWAYDAMNILAEAIKTAGEDRAKIREAILALKGYQGVLGTFSFTPNGDGLSEVSVVQIEQGKPKLLKSVSVEAK